MSVSAERSPQPGSDMAVVLNFLEEGRSRQEIAQFPGFSRVKVAYTICNLRRLGYYEQPLDERIAEWREAVSLGKGGIWPAVREYAAMHMSPAEIREAVIISADRELSSHQINTALPKARAKGDLPKRTTEEKLDIRKDGRRPREDIQTRVKLWLEVASLLKEYQLEEIPKGRADWINLIRFLSERKQYAHDKVTSNHSLFNDVLIAPYQEMPHLRPCLQTISSATAGLPYSKREELLYKAGWRINRHGEWSKDANFFFDVN